MKSELVFEPDGHRYFLKSEEETKEIPSVSEICRFISKEIYGEVDENLLRIASERGTAVHDATQKLDELGKAEVPEELAGYIQGYMKFLSEHSIDYKLIETPVTNGVYAGTIDRYGYVDDELSIVDIKTTGTIGCKHKILYEAGQNLYRRLLEGAGLTVDNLYILQLKKNGSYKLIKLKKEDRVIDALLKLHEILTF